jgi:uncharacterized protein (TIGR02145 family)
MVILLQGLASCKEIPEVSTEPVTNIAATEALTGGKVVDDFKAEVTDRGVCWSTNQSPSITDANTHDGSGLGSFESVITGLTYNTKYYVRAYATNSEGTGYGNEVEFTTTEVNREDADGNVYTSVTIGTQVWMVENLKTTKLSDGTEIPNVTDPVTWSHLTTLGYRWYNNDANTFKSPYGALYNWYAVNTGKLCPTNWHVPTDNDVTILETYLGGSYIAGGKLKETGTTHWLAPNIGATNETGFTALPGGTYNMFGYFDQMGVAGFWWYIKSSHPEDDICWFNICNYDPYIRFFLSGNSPGSTTQGFSVRCLRD